MFRELRNDFKDMIREQGDEFRTALKEQGCRCSRDDGFLGRLWPPVRGVLLKSSGVWGLSGESVWD